MPRFNNITTHIFTLCFVVLLLAFLFFAIDYSSPITAATIKSNHTESPDNPLDSTLENPLKNPIENKKKYSSPALLTTSRLTALSTITVDHSPAEGLRRAKARLRPELKAQGFKIGQPVFVRIFKAEKMLEVWLNNGSQFEFFKYYPICTYSGQLGPKLKEGDRQAPEGFYHVKKTSLNPASSYHLSFNLGYPNKYDRSHKRTGSYLMVHGNCLSVGCYAMTDPQIEEIYALVEAALNNGQRSIQVQALPFALTEENLERNANSQWFDFWSNLKLGYDYFNQHKMPPKVTTRNKKYVFQ